MYFTPCGHQMGHMKGRTIVIVVTWRASFLFQIVFNPIMAIINFLRTNQTVNFEPTHIHFGILSFLFYYYENQKITIIFFEKLLNPFWKYRYDKNAIGSLRRHHSQSFVMFCVKCGSTDQSRLQNISTIYCNYVGCRKKPNYPNEM